MSGPINSRSTSADVGSSSVEQNLVDQRALYLELLKASLTDDLYGDSRVGVELRPRAGSSVRNRLRTAFLGLLADRNLALVKKSTASGRSLGSEWPPLALTQVGRKRLDHLQSCIEDVIRLTIPGDLIETGVWRGGVTIFMRGVLRAYGVADRLVWAADSFSGLPRPDPARFPADAGDWLHAEEFLRVDLDTVRANFSKFGLLDDQVRFLRGWFKETLPNAPIERLAVLRLDGDMFESTWDALTNLYHKVSVGGYIIIDDYHAVSACRRAVDEFRRVQGITEQLQAIPRSSSGAFWLRERS